MHRMAVAALLSIALSPAVALAAEQTKAEVPRAEVAPTAEAVRNFSLAAFRSLYSLGSGATMESLSDNARYFSDVESYRGFLKALDDSQVLKTLAARGAALSVEISGTGSSAPESADLRKWKTSFHARETVTDRKGSSDRCVAVEMKVDAAGAPPLSDTYSIRSVAMVPASDKDCAIVAPRPIDKEAARVELINRRNSLAGFLQGASASLFALDFTEEEPQFKRSMRFFADGDAYESYRTAVSDMGLLGFLKRNQMISTGSYMGNLTFEKADDSPLWHTAFYVKQRFVEPAFDLSRCLGVAADVKELPQSFGSAEYAITTIAIHPMDDDSACESGKELTAAMWNLVNSSRDSDGQRETRDE